MSKFDIVGERDLTKPQVHRYEIEVSGNELKVHATMLMKPWVATFKSLEGTDDVFLSGAYQLTIKVGRLFSVEKTESSVKKIMEELVAPKIVKKSTAKKKSKRLPWNDEDLPDDDNDEDPVRFIDPSSGRPLRQEELANPNRPRIATRLLNQVDTEEDSTNEDEDPTEDEGPLSEFYRQEAQRRARNERSRLNRARRRS